jgi:hypothetical protein
MTTPWTPEELAYLREHYPTTAARNIAAALERTPAAVINKARLIGVTKVAYTPAPSANGPRERALQAYLQRRAQARCRVANSQGEARRVASVWELGAQA